jgi:hypothetical protein
MANSDYSTWQNPLSPLLGTVLGGQETTNVDKTTNNTNTGSINVSGSSSQKSNADVSNLEDVYAKQAAGITPEMLSSLFYEGSKQIPGLANAYGTAVGARTTSNVPLAQNILNLQAQLTSDAAKINNQMLSDSGKTAASIAELTKSMDTTSNTGTVTKNTIKNNESTDVTARKTIDPKSLKILAGLGIGGSALNWLLGGSGSKGGLNDLLGMLSGATKGIGSGNLDFGDWLSRLFSGEATGGNIGTLPGLGDIGSGLGTIDPGSFTDIGELLGGFADGGEVKKPNPEEVPGVTPENELAKRMGMLVKLMALKNMANSPEGMKQLESLRLNASSQQGVANESTVDSANTGSGVGTGTTGSGALGGIPGAIGSAVGAVLGIPGIATTLGMMGLNAALGAISPTNPEGINAVNGMDSEDNAATGTTMGLADSVASAMGIGLGVAPSVDGGSIGSVGDGTSGANPGEGDGSGVGADGSADGGDGGGFADGGRPRQQRHSGGTEDMEGMLETLAGTESDAEDSKEIADDIPIRVSEGEYVVPADVVRKKGTAFFDKLVEQYHTPAAMQRAMGA